MDGYESQPPVLEWVGGAGCVPAAEVGTDGRWEGCVYSLES
jgi:hypothetical protein